MQAFQSPYGPTENPLHDPFDHFADAFEKMVDAFGQAVPVGTDSLDPFAPPDFTKPFGDPGNLPADHIDDRSMLDSVEDATENSPPIPPAVPSADPNGLLSALQQNTVDTSTSPEPVTEVEPFEDPGWGYPAPSYGAPPPPPGLYDSPARRSRRDDRPTSHHWTRAKARFGSRDIIWCPIAKNLVSLESCKDACKYYDADSNACQAAGDSDSNASVQ